MRKQPDYSTANLNGPAMRRTIAQWVFAGALLAGAIGAPRATAAQDPPNPGRDAFLAEKNIEVGEFYLKKGNADAAMERFREAIRLRPAYARPYRLMGQAHEKKREAAAAAEFYEKYLELAPYAEDAAKIRKTIEKLKRRAEAQKNRRRK